MSVITKHLREFASLGLLLALATLLAGCGANAQRGAAEGGATGAVAGAVGGMVSALVFGGNVAEAGARGAVYGGATGATVGAMAGSKADSAEKARREAERAAERENELKVLEQELGPDAYNGIVALAECKYGVAVANATEARSSKNREHALAGIWVETLAEMDRENTEASTALFETLAAQDKSVGTSADAATRADEALKRLHELRVEYGLPANCP